MNVSVPPTTGRCGCLVRSASFEAGTDDGSPKGLDDATVRYANVMSSVAVFLSLGGTSYAVTKLDDDSVRSRHVVNGALTGADVKSSSLGSSDVKDGSLGSTDIKDGGLTGADVADKSITEADVAPLGSLSIADGSVTGNDVKNGTLTHLDVQPGTLFGTSIGDGSLAGADVEDGSLTSDDIADGSIRPEERRRRPGRLRGLHLPRDPGLRPADRHVGRRAGHEAGRRRRADLHRAGHCHHTLLGQRPRVPA
jgi:uncharacterized protein YjbI with pentapeptide repeats